VLKDLQDDQFFTLIFTSGDRLGMDYVEEAKRRKENMVPFLSRVLSEEENYQLEGKGFWAVVHAVHILGILGDLRGFHGLLSSGHFADVYEIDWIWEALPECYLRLGKEVIPLLMVHVEKEKASDFEVITNELYGLWNLWEAYPEERGKIEAFLLGILKDSAISPVTRANLMADFAEVHRRDLKPLFEGYYERGEVDLDTLPRADMVHFFGDVPRAPGYRRDLESFYSSQEIQKRHERWEKEDKEVDQQSVESYILENFRYISRNDPCPCGSGKKFKKCHLGWAEDKLLRITAEKGIDEDSWSIEGAVSKEKSSEEALRRFFAQKGKIPLFSEIKERSLRLIKAPQSNMATKGFSHFFGPILESIDFESNEELQEFMNILLEYHNALAAQFPPDYPRNRRSFH
jgi:hypothetical protein